MPGNPQIYSNLGDALVKQGQTAEAVRCYQEALRLNPGDPRIGRNCRRWARPSQIEIRIAPSRPSTATKLKTSCRRQNATSSRNSGIASNRRAFSEVRNNVGADWTFAFRQASRAVSQNPKFQYFFGGRRRLGEALRNRPREPLGAELRDAQTNRLARSPQQHFAQRASRQHIFVGHVFARAGAHEQHSAG